MSKLVKAVLGGLLFTCYLMCFVFAWNLIGAFQDHTPMGEFLMQQVLDFFVFWLFCSIVAHGVIGMFDDLNKPRSDDRDGRDSRNLEDQSRNDQVRPDDSDKDSTNSDNSKASGDKPGDNNGAPKQ
jgi:hypothetical protein